MPHTNNSMLPPMAEWSLKARCKPFIMPVVVCLGLSACTEYERQDIRITNMQKDTSWLFKQLDPIITERQFSVRVEGELDEEAALEIQHRIFGSPVPDSIKRIVVSYTTLPKGKFSYGFWDDSGSPRKFMFHPVKARKGYVRVLVRSGRLEKESTWTELKSDPERSGIVDMSASDL